MADQDTVCCMCGDIGFADKLFRCSHCRFRFQHSYCSNYNNKYSSQQVFSPTSSSSSSTESLEICDWCQSEGRKTSITSKNQSGSYKRSLSLSLTSSSSVDHRHIRSEYTSAERVKQHQDHHHTAAATSSPGERVVAPKHNNYGVQSPRSSAHRRYKLLKDVMC